MKAIILFSLTVLLTSLDTQAQESTNILIGKWKLDMSPQNTSDDNFAMMEITSVKDNKMKGTFYRKGVKLKNGFIDTQTETIYGALMSGDNSGSYNTSFYLKDGKLYGTTLAVDREFLAVWVATKE